MRPKVPPSQKKKQHPVSLHPDAIAFANTRAVKLYDGNFSAYVQALIDLDKERGILGANVNQKTHGIILSAVTPTAITKQPRPVVGV